MMIGVMMKVMQTSIACTNMMNIHILKSFLNVILVLDIYQCTPNRRKIPAKPITLTNTRHHTPLSKFK